METEDKHMGDDSISLPIINSINISKPLKRSNTEFMFYDKDHHGFMIYNSIKKQWQFLQQKEHDPKWIRCFAFDNNNNRFYSGKYDTAGNRMIVTIRNMDDSEQIINHKDLYLGWVTSDTFAWAGCAFANGKFHVIGGWCNKSHIVFDPAAVTNRFKIVYTFDEWSRSSSLPGLVYVSSKNQFYLLGGWHDPTHQWLDEIWRCDINDSGNAYKWHKIQLKLPKPTCYRYMLTNNEKFIIAASEREIIYHELGTNEWIKSKIPSPSYRTWLVMTDDRTFNRMIVVGYVRGWKIDIPEDIAMMIFTWYNCEEVHIIFLNLGDKTTYHNKVDIHRIIPHY